MEVTLTFGSVGDIIALCNLAVKLGRALGESPCGSAKVYRDLQRDLDISVRVLSRVWIRSPPLSNPMVYRAELKPDI